MLRFPMALLLALLIDHAAAQTTMAGTVERIRVHGKSLEGNLSGDSPDRDVSVYLPPSYNKNSARRYPTLYFLHGFTDSDEKWFGFVKHWIHLPQVLDKAMSAGAREMIVVMPNAFTRFAGSMYSPSVTNGDWETFIVRDLVAHIDSRYRTRATREARGLAGHSMGGYGTLRIAMRHADTFSSIYALNPCCLSVNTMPSEAAIASWAKAESIRSDEEFAKANFFIKAGLASAAAWSPNPANPPFFADLPVKNGQLQPQVLARWAAQAPLSLLDQSVFQLRRLQGIAIDAGDQEGSITTTTRELHAALERYRIAHEFEIYEGGHINRVAERIATKVMPFFSARLP